MTIAAPPGYEALGRILERALQQAATGKGHERHAVGGEPWHEQHIVRTNMRAGNDGHAVGQAEKKLDEGKRMDTEAAVKEYLGAIVYAAAAVETRERLATVPAMASQVKVDTATYGKIGVDLDAGVNAAGDGQPRGGEAVSERMLLRLYDRVEELEKRVAELDAEISLVRLKYMSDEGR